MDYRDRILMEIADRECKRICRSVIRGLQRLKDTLSAEDSGLKNVWEEVCAQVQSDYSWSWEAYVKTMEGLIGGLVARLDQATLGAIWLQTDAFYEWDEKDRHPPVDEGDVVSYMLEEYVLREAADWRNRRLERYVERGYELY